MAKISSKGISEAVITEVLQFLNTAETPEDIAGNERQDGPVYDDPSTGYSEQGYDIGIEVAERILAKRPPGGFTQLEQLSDIPGFGHDKFRDLVYSFGGRLADPVGRWYVNAPAIPMPPIREGNEVLPLIGGHETFAKMVAAIGTAQEENHYIYLLGWWLSMDFPLEPGKPGTTMENLLKTASDRGVQVRAMLWDQTLPSAAPRWLLRVLLHGIDERLLSQLPNARAVTAINGLRNGAAVLDKRTLWYGSHHQKILVVKSSKELIAFCGGVDINVQVFYPSPVGAPYTYVHSKLWIFDDEFAIVGSANCNRRGYTHDSEVMAAILDPSVVKKLRIDLWAKHLRMDTPKERARLEDGVSSAELWNGAWRQNDLTQASQRDGRKEVPKAAGDPAGYILRESQHVIYRGTDDHIHELYWIPTSGWRHNDLTKASEGAPVAAGDPAGYVLGDSQHVVYRGANGRIQELWWLRVAQFDSDVQVFLIGEIPLGCSKTIWDSFVDPNGW